MESWGEEYGFVMATSGFGIDEKGPSKLIDPFSDTEQSDTARLFARSGFKADTVVIHYGRQE